MSEDRFQSFEEFWPYYVGEHKDPRCRALHYVGTTLAISTVGAAVLTANPLWLLATPIVGYGPAWFGHFVIEKNRPATFKYPTWSLRGDFRMLALALQGRMAEEVERLHPRVRVTPDKREPEAGASPVAERAHASVAVGANGTATA